MLRWGQVVRTVHTWPSVQSVQHGHSVLRGRRGQATQSGCLPTRVARVIHTLTWEWFASAMVAPETDIPPSSSPVLYQCLYQQPRSMSDVPLSPHFPRYRSRCGRDQAVSQCDTDIPAHLSPPTRLLWVQRLLTESHHNTSDLRCLTRSAANGQCSRCRTEQAGPEQEAQAAGTAPRRG